MLAQIVIDDEHILPLGHKILPHGRTGVGRDVLQGGRVAGGGRHNDGVVHGSMPLERIPHPGHRGRLLSNGHIDADHVLPFLVEDGVHRNGGLARLAVADEQLTLSPPNGDHGINGQDPGLKRGVHRLPGDHAAGLMLNGPGLCGADGPHSVQRLSQGVHDPAQHGLAHRHIGGAARAGHDAALPQAGLLSQQDAAHAVPGQVHDHALNTGLKLHQFAVHRPVQTLDLGNSVAYADNPADLLDLAHGLEILDPGLEVLDQAAHVAAVLHLEALDLGLQALYQALQFLTARIKIALESLGQPLQTSPDTAVIDHALDLQAKAAQNGRVDLDLKDHPVQAPQAAHRPAQILQGGLIRLPGAGDHAHRAALGRQLQLPQLP